MNDFTHILRRADGRLVAPEPQRSRILLEIAQDLEELYATYRARGCSEADARARAEAVFDASDESLEALGRVHAPMYVRLLERFSEGHRHRAERLLLSVLALLAVVTGAYTLFDAAPSRSASPFLWPLLGLGALSAWVLGRATLRLYLHPYRPPSAPELAPVLGLAGASLVTGILGLLVETWQLAGGIEAKGTAAAEVVLPYLARTAGQLTLSVTLGLAVLLAWFHLRRRALEIDRVQRAVHRLTRAPTTGGE